eukprot:CAMPEP_0204333884 /NCGR_PEP_ID=MMETSP0469-20131031/17581_1 /ASSEMBLY_ACC=CAM_ASM_000384 /TAXON_ID=2969 /ORGANISM="Oxyrrhis marina" /LENGTH=473 /DNA_ID=CAMNT_0051317301 /DNA_START=8 /DNA_END=1429 /DNA_ORIENTATION=-
MKKGGSTWSTLKPEVKYQFGLLLVTATLIHADQNLAAPNLSAIADDFEMTPMQKYGRLGGLVQFGFFLIGGAVSLLIGPMADKLDRTTLLPAVVCCGAVPALFSVFIPSSKAGFFWFLLGRVCTGIAVGGSYPVIYSFCGDLFPASQRTFVSACVGAATNIGAATGGLLGGVLGPWLGWRLPYCLMAVPALACAALVKLTLKDPRGGKPVEDDEDEEPDNAGSLAWAGGREFSKRTANPLSDLDFSKFSTIFACQTNVMVFCQSLPGCIPLSIVVTYLADYLATEQGLSVGAATGVTAVFGLACLGCAFAGSGYGASLYARDKSMFCRFISVTTLCAIVPFVVLINAPASMISTETGSPRLFTLLLAMGGGINAVAGPNIKAVLMNVNSAEVRGTVFSAFTLTDDLGKGLGPTLVFVLIAICGRRAAFTLGFCFWGISSAVLFMMGQTLPRDARAMTNSGSAGGGFGRKDRDV